MKHMNLMKVWVMALSFISCSAICIDDLKNPRPLVASSVSESSLAASSTLPEGMSPIVRDNESFDQKLARLEVSQQCKDVLIHLIDRCGRARLQKMHGLVTQLVQQLINEILMNVHTDLLCEFVYATYALSISNEAGVAIALKAHLQGILKTCELKVAIWVLKLCHMYAPISRKRSAT